MADIGTTKDILLDAAQSSGTQPTKIVERRDDFCTGDASGGQWLNVTAGTSSCPRSANDPAAFSAASGRSYSSAQILTARRRTASVKAVRASPHVGELESLRPDQARGSRWAGRPGQRANPLKVLLSSVTEPVSKTVPANPGTGPWPVTDNGGSLTVDGSVAATQSGAWSVSVTDTPLVTLGAALPAGGNNIGDVDIASAIPAGTNVIGNVGPAPQASGGVSAGRVISAASTNATSVKASAGQVFGVYAHNTNAAARYLKLYNKASAPTVGTDTPVLALPIPGNTAGAGFVLEPSNGIAFGTGIALALTAGVGDSDSTAVAANEFVVNLLYK